MQKNQSLIFIHGAWHASWCWNRIAKPLRAAGYNVLTPDLPGHGLVNPLILSSNTLAPDWGWVFDKPHPCDPASLPWLDGSKTQPQSEASSFCKNALAVNTIRFNDYITSIMTLIKQQPTPVTLIGHSMAGLVIAQIAEMIPDHIHELIFIAAYIPQNQESLLSIAAKSDSHAVSPLLIIDQKQREIRLKATKKLTDVFFNRCSKQDAASAIAKLQPQPLQPFSATVTIGANFSRIPKRAFICNYDKALVVSDQLRMSKIVTDNIIYLDSDHAAYYSGESAIIAALL